MTRIRVCLVFCLLLLFFPKPVFATKDSSVLRSSTLVFAFQSGLMNIKDRSVSPNWYSGLFTGGMLEWNKEKAHFRHRINGVFQYGSLSHTNSSGNALTFGGAANYWGLWRKNEARFSFGFRTGFAVSYRFNEAWGNSSGTYENMVDLAPAVSYHWPFRLKERSFTIGKRIYSRKERAYVFSVYGSFSPFGMVSRTPYAGISDFTDGSSTRFPGKDFRFTGTGGLQRVFVSTQLTRFHLNGNSITLSYAWDFYRIKEPNTVKAAIHAITFGFNFLHSRQPCKTC